MESEEGPVWQFWVYSGFGRWLLGSLIIMVVVTLLWNKLEKQNMMAFEMCGRYWHSNDLSEKDAISKHLMWSGVFLCNEQIQPEFNKQPLAHSSPKREAFQ
jgi:hypothetical protein